MVSRRSLAIAAAAGAVALTGIVAAVAAAGPSSTKKVASTTYWDVYADSAWYSANGAALTPLLPYLDAFVSQLVSDFGYSVFPLPAGQARLALVLDPKSGGAATGTTLGLEGVTVAADAVTNSYDGIPAFWFYILPLHETINDWTGSLAADWVWADGSPLWAGSSPFPNACDVLVTEELGYSQVSAAQASRMTSDAGVELFLNIQKTYGWSAFQKVFALTYYYGITNWGAYTEPLRTAILAWFFTQATGVDQLNAFNTAVSADSGQTIPLATYQQAQSMFPTISPIPKIPSRAS